MIFPFCVVVSLVVPVVSNFISVGKEGYVDQPGEAFSTVGEVEYMTHAAFVRNSSISLGATEVAMSISAVWSTNVMT